MVESPNELRLLVVMGVAGSGKSTVAAALAAARGATFLDADAYHPPANVAKMGRGAPLTDADRGPWLTAFGAALASPQGAVVGACSALKRAYRDRIRELAGESVAFVHLTAPTEVIARRLRQREGHFMPASMLDSQLATLELPEAGERALSVPVDAPLDAVLERIELALRDLQDQSTHQPVAKPPLW